MMKKFYSVLMMLAAVTYGMSQVVFLETFDGVGGPTAGGPGTFTFPSGWTLLNLDGRTPATQVAYVNDAWERREDFANNVNDSAAFSTSWYSPAGAADDWMWTPAIANLPANCILSWNAIAYDAAYPDGYQVRIMTTAPNAGNTYSSTILLSVPAENPTWTSRNLSLNAYAGQTVYIGFRNNSNDQFLLLVDDVKVMVKPKNDLAITSTTQEYTLTPSRQVPGTGYPFGVKVYNNGLNNATNVVLNVAVYNSSLFLMHSVSSTPVGVASGATITLNAPAFSSPAVDAYLVAYSVSSDSVDQIPADNVDTGYFAVTNSEYARDNGKVVGALGIGAGNGGYLGQDFRLNQSANLNFIGGYVNSANAGDRIAAVVWNMIGDTIPGSIIASTDTLVYPDDSARYYQIPMHGGMVNLPAGKYAFTFVEFDSTLRLAQTSAIFNPKTTWVDWPTNPLGRWANNEDFGVNFANAYVVRPIFCATITPNFTITNPACSASTGAATVNVLGGDMPYSYAWGTGSIADNISGVPAGNYPVTVTDAIGCSITAVAAISNTGSNLSATATITDASSAGASDGSITLNITGGTAPYTVNPSNLTGLAPGTYNVTVTDNNGCIFSATYTVSFSTAIKDISEAGVISIYPNPASSDLFVAVDLKAAGDVEMNLYSVTGANVYSHIEKGVSTRVMSIPVAELPAGAYTIQVKTNGHTTNRLVNVQK